MNSHEFYDNTYQEIFPMKERFEVLQMDKCNYYFQEFTILFSFNLS